ncbi:hypothetical protein ALQ18_03433, partial [Pseudomonas marginalis pv. marginalis]
NPLSLLFTAERVVGVGLAVASVGLTIRRRNPRYLIGLVIPSLGTPVIRGKVDFPSIRAFDRVTGLTLPMLEGLEAIRAFTAETGAASEAAKALPVPPALTASTATTQDLIEILKASQALEAQVPPSQSWLDQAKGAVASVTP